MPQLQDHLENAYLELSPEEIASRLEHFAGSELTHQEKAVLRFLQEVSLVNWIRQKNEVQGVAPSFRMATAERMALAGATATTAHAREPDAQADASHKKEVDAAFPKPLEFKSYSPGSDGVHAST